jgi:hypothetical protein
MAIIPRNFSDFRGAPSEQSLVPRAEHTRSHFCNYAVGGVHLDISRGGPRAVTIVGPWHDTVDGQEVVIVASAEQRGTLSIEESNEDDPAEAESSLVLGILEHEPQGARVQVTARKYRVTFTPSFPCSRVYIETQSRP